VTVLRVSPTAFSSFFSFHASEIAIDGRHAVAEAKVGHNALLRLRTMTANMVAAMLVALYYDIPSPVVDDSIAALTLKDMAARAIALL